MQSGTTSTSGTSTSATYSFEGFLQGWFHRQDQLLAEIEAVASGKAGRTVAVAEAQELIARALGHFEEYYDHKSRETHRNVLALFSPTWCSSFECAFFWITGFRPGVLFQLVIDSVYDLSHEQTRALDRLKRETKVEEKGVADELARLQETIAQPPLMGVLMRGGELILDEQHSATTIMNESMEWLRVALEGVVVNADSLRVTTAAKVVQILSPFQCLRFLAATIQLQHGIRNLGMERDRLAQRESIT